MAYDAGFIPSLVFLRELHEGIKGAFLSEAEVVPQAEEQEDMLLLKVEGSKGQMGKNSSSTS